MYAQPTDTDSIVVKVEEWGAEGGKAGGKWETFVIVLTIKNSSNLLLYSPT